MCVASYSIRSWSIVLFAVLITLFSAPYACSQVLMAVGRLPAPDGVSSSLPDKGEGTFADTHEDAAAAAISVTRPYRSLWHGLGFSAHIGINGAGGDIALPVAPHFNIRAGGDYTRYSTTFTEEGANVAAALRLGHGKVALDWYPFGNGFRVSPMAVFAVQTHLDATVLVPAGQTITLDGGDYVSSNADPLRGSATVKTRSAAPGLTVGWGNIAPHGERHWTFPVEVGFYYIGQPNLTVTFQGSACDPNYPQPLGCQHVTQDAGFQRDLNAFIRRNQNNLSYASLFPEASFGVGYRF